MSSRDQSIYFTYNLETTDLRNQVSAEVCQIAVRSQDGNIFCEYVLPCTAEFTDKAKKANGFEISNLNGKRRLLQKKIPVETVSLDKALEGFLHFLKENSPDGATINLIAYYSIHDETFLERISSQCNIPLEVEGRILRFLDAIKPVKRLRNKGEWLFETDISRKNVHRFLHGNAPLNAEGSHDALADVKMLMDIIEHEKYPLDELLDVGQKCTSGPANFLVYEEKPIAVDRKKAMTIPQEKQDESNPEKPVSFTPEGTEIRSMVQKRKQLQGTPLMDEKNPKEGKKPRLCSSSD